jgi:hypothetical protein
MEAVVQNGERLGSSEGLSRHSEAPTQDLFREVSRSMRVHEVDLARLSILKVQGADFEASHEISLSDGTKVFLTPLQYAIELKNSNMVHALIMLEVDRNNPGRLGKSPMQMARDKGFTEAVGLLGGNVSTLARASRR